MFGSTPTEIRESGSLNLKVGDLVKMNPAAMMNGGGFAIIIGKSEDVKGLYNVHYLKNSYEIPADDMIDILEVVSRAN